MRWSTPPIRSAPRGTKWAEFPDRGPERTGEISCRSDVTTLTKVGPQRRDALNVLRATIATHTPQIGV